MTLPSRTCLRYLSACETGSFSGPSAASFRIGRLISTTTIEAS